MRAALPKCGIMFGALNTELGAFERSVEQVAKVMAGPPPVVAAGETHALHRNGARLLQLVQQFRIEGDRPAARKPLARAA